LKIVEAINTLQRQAWNQILQLLCNKRSSCSSHFANMLPNNENKLQCTNVSNVMRVPFCLVFFQCTKQSGPRTLIRSQFWPSIQKVWGPLVYTFISCSNKYHPPQ